MAEFQEVMRQWRRFCQSHNNCGECEFDGKGICSEAHLSDIPYANIELRIMAWAAEHPEPVYPTWGEWLESEGICFSRLTNYERIDGFSIPQVFDYQIDGKTAFICGDKVNTPIHTDMAQKLGIEPKEGA